MTEIDKEIDQLEQRLAELRASRRGSEQDREWKVGDPFMVVNDNELYLPDIPDLLRLILEALPVSVFIKHAEGIDQKGRLFTYLNQKARSRLKWTSEEVSRRYDSDAFLNAWDSELYQTMYAQETDTLNGAVSRYTQLEWQPGEDFWRRSKTLEVPIFKRDEVEKGPLGFCAIAEEVEFEMFPFIHSWLRRVFDHEYNNMCGDVKWNIDSAIGLLAKLKTLGVSSREAKEVFAKFVDKTILDLESAGKYLSHYGLSSVELYKAFSPINYKTSQPVSEIINDLHNIFDNAPFLVTFAMSDDSASARIKKSAAVKGVLIALTNNARKHAADKKDPQGEIKVSASADGAYVSFVVGNRCNKLEGVLTPRTFVGALEHEAGTDHLTGAIVGELLARAFPSDVWTKMLLFPDAPVDGWLNVTLRCDTEELRPL